MITTGFLMGVATLGASQFFEQSRQFSFVVVATSCFIIVLAYASIRPKAPVRVVPSDIEIHRLLDEAIERQSVSP